MTSIRIKQVPSPTAVQDHAPVELNTVPRPSSFSAALVQGLQRLGVDTAFGIVGGALAPFCDALHASSIRVVHCRHEAGAAFAALEASLITGKPAVIFSTTGPGITNAITGITAARWEGARVIVVSAITGAAQRGRWAFQETSPARAPFAGLFEAGPLFHHAVAVQDAQELPQLLSRLNAGLAKPGGFVAHVGLPVGIQKQQVTSAPRMPELRLLGSSGNPAAAAECARLLQQGSNLLWLGFGARAAAPQISELAERLGLPVVCTPRGKGIFPESHPQFLGVTGFTQRAHVAEHLQRNRPAHTLVLGTRMGEFSSSWDPTLVPSKSFIHVDVDDSVFGAAYPEAPCLGIQADIAPFVTELLKHLPRTPRLVTTVAAPPDRVPETPPSPGLVRPQVLMDAIQRRIVDRSDTWLMTEAGNSFAWGTASLRFGRPNYRVSVGFGSMGHAAAGVLGACLALKGKAVAVLGDGAMLMTNELSTAVDHALPAVWIVLNDALYGMIDQGMRGLGLHPVETHIPRADFVGIAKAMGADGIRVTEESALDAALDLAMAAPGPFVVDVTVDPREQAPFLARVKNLLTQQGAADGKRP